MLNSMRASKNSALSLQTSAICCNSAFRHQPSDFVKTSYIRILLHQDTLTSDFLHLTSRYSYIFPLTSYIKILLHLTSRYSSLFLLTSSFIRLLHLTSRYSYIFHLTSYIKGLLHLTSYILHQDTLTSDFLHLTSRYSYI